MYISLKAVWTSLSWLESLAGCSVPVQALLAPLASPEGVTGQLPCEGCHCSHSEKVGVDKSVNLCWPHRPTPCFPGGRHHAGHTLESKKAGSLNVREINTAQPYLKNMIGEMSFSKS